MNSVLKEDMTLPGHIVMEEQSKDEELASKKRPHKIERCPNQQIVSTLF